MKQQTLLVVAKAPIAGFSKTRLAKDVGERNALRIYQTLLEEFFFKVGKLSQIDLNLFITPKSTETFDYFKMLLESQKVLASQIDFQSERPFFKKLVEIISSFQGAKDFIHLTGTDIPDFPFQVMPINPKEDTIYIGPDKDGGYYYIGMPPQYAHLLDIEISDGSTSVLAQTIKNIDDYGVKYEILQEWSDIDTLEDLHTTLKRSGSELEKLTKLVISIGL